jgi:hypothetical protein
MADIAHNRQVMHDIAERGGFDKKDAFHVAVGTEHTLL